MRPDFRCPPIEGFHLRELTQSKALGVNYGELEACTYALSGQ